MFDLSTKILVVDDMATMRKIVIRSLKEFGFTDFTEASDGALAWGLLQATQNPYGLVISDWNMPNCSGLELLKRVRADGKLKPTPFILLTAESEASQISQALTLAVDGYIIKPFNSEVLKNKMEEASKKAAKPKVA